jgi:hypothetical protein
MIFPTISRVRYFGKSIKGGGNEKEKTLPHRFTKYENLAEKIVTAFMRYSEDVRSKAFPEDEHAYKMTAGELPKLREKLIKY